MSDDIILPPEARLDPRRGLHGGQYVILTCAICGREVRYPLPWYRARLKRGGEPKTGEALREVLLGMHTIPDEGIEAQVVRW